LLGSELKNMLITVKSVTFYTLPFFKNDSFVSVQFFYSNLHLILPQNLLAMSITLKE